MTSVDSFTSGTRCGGLTFATRLAGDSKGESTEKHFVLSVLRTVSLLTDLVLVAERVLPLTVLVANLVFTYGILNPLAISYSELDGQNTHACGC